MTSDAEQRRLAWLKIKIIQMEELCRLCHSRLQITQNIFEKRREADAQAPLSVSAKPMSPALAVH
ncbi:hypothetical protein AGMMS49925_11530 [Deltaproteobacteria bacterium]|nr:hypothetical protein AGMMS49925_11530 [Deltaproteobacteria bacterium]